MCADSQVLVDLYVNYDCDLEAADLFERTLLTLVALLQVRRAVGQSLSLTVAPTVGDGRVDRSDCP